MYVPIKKKKIKCFDYLGWLTFQYVTKIQTQIQLAHSAADRSYIQPLNQRHNATNCGIPEFGSLKFSEFSQLLEPKQMVVTAPLASLLCLSALFF